MTVLEATEQFPDRVRGESMQAWGVHEARELGVEDVLLAAGAHVAPTWRQYFPNGDEPRDIPMNMMVPGIGGSLNLRHPDACQALVDAAAAGRSDGRSRRDGRSASSAGSSPVGALRRRRARTSSSGRRWSSEPTGRRSVTRRALGITLERSRRPATSPACCSTTSTACPTTTMCFVGEDDLWFLLFHQGGSRARAYVCTGLSGQHRFAGPDGTARFLEACAVSSYPWSEQVAAATPAGPCATYPATTPGAPSRTPTAPC